MGEYTFLANPNMVAGRLDGPILTLWAKDTFVKGLIDKPGVLNAVEEAAKARLGGSCRAQVKLGTPPAPRPAAKGQERDKLEDLLALGRQFSDIITEE